MTISSDPDDSRNWLVERWYAYGDQFSVFVPEDTTKAGRLGFSAGGTG